MRSSPAREKSLEYVLAARCPKKTRTPIAREPDSLSVSTCPSRTRVENSSPSRTTHSAAVAPPFIARRTMSVATSLRSVSSFGFRVSSSVGVIKSFYAEASRLQALPEGKYPLRSAQSVANLLHEAARILPGRSADREPIHFESRNPHAHRHSLPILAAGAYAFVQLQVISYHRYAR